MVLHVALQHPAGGDRLAQRGDGTLYIEARKSAERWTFRVLRLVPDDGAPIDLRTPQERTGEPDATAEGDAVDA